MTGLVRLRVQSAGAADNVGWKGVSPAAKPKIPATLLFGLCAMWIAAVIVSVGAVPPAGVAIENKSTARAPVAGRASGGAHTVSENVGKIVELSTFREEAIRFGRARRAPLSEIDKLRHAGDCTQEGSVIRRGTDIYGTSHVVGEGPYRAYRGDLVHRDGSGGETATGAKHGRERERVVVCS